MFLIPKVVFFAANPSFVRQSRPVHADLSHADDIFRYSMGRVSNLGQ